ncbi:MAG: GNAT family N-acetyltransferase [Burkholderiales bacterium]|uniref:GNAT family N-acetyltransferase n=1 Tax=Inhella sp. TaxID=1921806 RepID=UPI001AD49CC2|nr:GNAT family N-acetyltransferase [Burkholderiales bacterium]
MPDVIPLRLEHAPSFRDCLDAVARESLMLGQSGAPSLERVQAFVADNVAAGHPAFVAWDGHQVLGWADAIPLWADGLRHRAQFGMGVRREWRGRGLGQRLGEAVIAAAHAQGDITRIDLEVRADNGPAIRLYERLGFVLEGRRAKGLCHRGVFFETVEMGLLL